MTPAQSYRLSSLYASSDRDAGITGRLDRRLILPRYSGASSGLCIAHQASTYGHPRATNILLLNQPCIKQFYLTTIIRDFSFKTVRETWNWCNKWNLFFLLFSRQLYLGRSGSWRFVAGGTTWIRFSSQKWMAKPFDYIIFFSVILAPTRLSSGRMAILSSQQLVHSPSTNSSSRTRLSGSSASGSVTRWQFGSSLTGVPLRGWGVHTTTTRNTITTPRPAP